MISASQIRFTLLLAVLATALSACPPEQPEQPESGSEVFLETEDDKTIYAMGVNLARNLDNLPLSESEKQILQTGFADGMEKRDPQVDTDRYGRGAEGLFTRRNADLAKEESDA